MSLERPMRGRSGHVRYTLKSVMGLGVDGSPFLPPVSKCSHTGGFNWGHSLLCRYSWGDVARVEGSLLTNLVSFLRCTSVSLARSQLVEENNLGDSVNLDPTNMASPVELGFHQHSFTAGQLSMLLNVHRRRWRSDGSAQGDRDVYDRWPESLSHTGVWFWLQRCAPFILLEKKHLNIVSRKQYVRNL